MNPYTYRKVDSNLDIIKNVSRIIEVLAKKILNKEYLFRLLKSLNGKGTCYHYAFLTNKLLNRIGIKSYLYYQRT